MGNQTTKNIHWFIIDDDTRALDHLHAELKDGGIDDAYIHCLCPKGRVEFKESALRPEFRIKDESVVPDWDYEVEEIKEFRNENGNYSQTATTTLFSLLNKVAPEGAETYFVFFIDILYEDNGSKLYDYDYCGFDIFRSIRWMIKPELYIVRLLSHLSRRLMSAFLDNEYSELKLGSEKSKENLQTEKGKRPNALKDFRIDMGFFSKASLRETPGTINILNQYIIDCIQDALPRKVLNSSIFGIYSNSYPQNTDKESWDNEMTTSIENKKIRLGQGVPQKSCKKTRLFKSRENFLKCIYVYLKINGLDYINIGLYKKSPKITLEWGKSTQGAIKDGMHFDYVKGGSTISLDFSKRPIYREELQKWYHWISLDDPSKSESVIDILFIGEKIDVEIDGCKSDSNATLSIDELHKLKEKIGRLRPRYLVANLPKDKDRDVLQAIIEATTYVPKFEIHGFGVYFYDPEDKIGVNKCCKLPPKDQSSGKIRITNPISPIYWKLSCLLNLQDQEDTIRHKLVHKLYSLTTEGWETAKKELSDMYELKYLLTQDKSYQTQSECIRESEYNDEQEYWEFNDDKIKEHKELFKRLGLTPIKEGSIHWVLVSDKDKLETALTNELKKLSAYPLISNGFNFNGTKFHRWRIQEIETQEKLKNKLKALKSETKDDSEPPFVFLFDTTIPEYQYETKKKEKNVTTAIQIISGFLENTPLAFRILFTYKEPDDRKRYFTNREYLQFGKADRIWKNARQVAYEKGNLFCYYSDAMESASSTATVSIISPDILYFIQEDLISSIKPNYTICQTLIAGKLTNEKWIAELKELHESYKAKNDKKFHLKPCKWKGYKFESDDLIFYQNRLIILLKFLDSGDPGVRYGEFREDFKFYKISHEAEKVNWDKLLLHEQKILQPIVENLIAQKKKEFSRLPDKELRDAVVTDFFRHYTE